MIRSVRIRSALAAVLLVLFVGHAGARGQVVVSAAVSLTNVLQELAPIYQKRTGDQIVLNLAASNKRAQQIRFGAPVDVFISADEIHMDKVPAQLVAGSRFDLLGNQLPIAISTHTARTFIPA